jgi:hypothetical protein
MPWIAEAILLLRIAVVFSGRRLRFVLASPIAVKVTRAVFTIIFCVRWAKLTVVHGGFSNAIGAVKSFPLWLMQSSFILELFDNRCDVQFHECVMFLTPS